jgi:threonine dehydrogenase-like Zn-dependent dehydrogenase
MGLWAIQAIAGNMVPYLFAIDIDEEKLKLAKKFGATHTINPLKQNAEEYIAKITGGHMADFVIEGTGSPKTVKTAMQCLRKGKGRLVLMSSYEHEDEGFNYKMAMEKSIEVRVAHGLYSNNEMDDMRRAVECLNSGAFKMDEIINHTFELNEIEKAFQTLENKPTGYLKGIVVPYK